MAPERTDVTGAARSWRCRHGIHRWTTIPRCTLALARDAGLRRHPMWYVGVQVPAYCERCGVAEARRILRGEDDTP